MTYDELKAKIDEKRKHFVSVPVFVPADAANGTMSPPVIMDDAVEETWTVTAKANPATFTVTGSVSGLDANEATPGEIYVTADGKVSFLLTDGSVTFEENDEFTFSIEHKTSGVEGATIIRELNFIVHSQADDVKVGYDVENNAIRVIKMT